MEEADGNWSEQHNDVTTMARQRATSNRRFQPADERRGSRSRRETGRSQQTRDGEVAADERRGGRNTTRSTQDGNRRDDADEGIAVAAARDAEPPPTYEDDIRWSADSRSRQGGRSNPRSSTASSGQDGTSPPSGTSPRPEGTDNLLQPCRTCFEINKQGHVI
jgi:hypothetical protein